MVVFIRPCCNALQERMEWLIAKQMAWASFFYYSGQDILV
mgnify:CR=1 FL=1